MIVLNKPHKWADFWYVFDWTDGCLEFGRISVARNGNDDFYIVGCTTTLELTLRLKVTTITSSTILDQFNFCKKSRSWKYIPWPYILFCCARDVQWRSQSKSAASLPYSIYTTWVRTPHLVEWTIWCGRCRIVIIERTGETLRLPAQLTWICRLQYKNFNISVKMDLQSCCRNWIGKNRK